MNRRLAMISLFGPRIAIAGLLLCAAAALAQPGGAPAEQALTAEQAARLARQDEFQAAIVKRDAARVQAMIRAGMPVDFNFDELTRGRTGESPLTLCINRGHLEIARLLLEAGANPGRQDGFGRTAIHRARSAEAVQLLVKHGADVNALDSRRMTPLAQAVERGDQGAIDLLIASGARTAGPGAADLFMIAATARHPEVIPVLLARGADPRSPPTQALWTLTDNGDTANARRLLERGADPDADNGRDRILLRALFRKHWEIAAALLDAGASLKIPDRPGCERFVACDSIQAARLASFDPSFLARLKSRGLDLDAAGAAGHTALTSLIVEQPMAIRAVGGGQAVGVASSPTTGQTVITQSRPPAPVAEIPAPDNAARVKVLLDAGADPNRKFRILTPLMLAVLTHGRPAAMTDALIAAGGRIEYDATVPPPKQGASGERIAAPDDYQGLLTDMRVGPLSWAVMAGRPDIALRLLERDRRIEAADRNLLYFAASAGAWELVIAALRHKAEPNAKNRAGVTPLMLAADTGRADVVRALIAGGADVRARSAQEWPPPHEQLRQLLGGAIAGHSASRPRLVGGYTALRAAQERGHEEVVRVLREAGAT